MNIPQSKAQNTLLRFRMGELPPGKLENVPSGENLVERYKGLKEQVSSDDNSPLDSDNRAGFVTYSGGERLGHSYEVQDEVLLESYTSAGYASIDEYRFSDSGVERVSVSCDAVGTGPAGGRLTFDRVTSGEPNLLRESWWLDVNPPYKDLFVPNIDTH